MHIIYIQLGDDVYYLGIKLENCYGRNSSTSNVNVSEVVLHWQKKEKVPKETSLTLKFKVVGSLR